MEKELNQEEAWLTFLLPRIQFGRWIFLLISQMRKQRLRELGVSTAREAYTSSLSRLHSPSTQGVCERGTQFLPLF